ncbi:MAG: NADP-dependent malic enzyme, partial [Methylococcales bacterium]|nr:NADP-dependent malic enzyme [Methylococcales bacterium]
MTSNYDYQNQAMAFRRRYQGLISVRSKVPVRDSHALSLVYTPGVAEPCLEIARDAQRSFDVTCRGNTIAIVSTGSFAFGLGDVGLEAILPVLEGTAVIVKNFAGVDALPLAIKTNSIDELAGTILNIAPTFGAICLEDIISPGSLSITYRLERALNIPVVNNHREGVAIGVLAGLINSAKLTGKKLKEMRIVINGAGAAGLGVAFLLYRYGIKNTVVCDREGAIYKYRPLNMNWAKWEIAKISNPQGDKGSLKEMLKGADVFIDFVIGAGEVTSEICRDMAESPILFLFGTPLDIKPQDAYKAGAAIVATSQSTYPNQMDISAVVPGVFRGLLDVRARSFPVAAQIAAAKAIANVIPEGELHANYIYPRILDYRVAPAVAAAVAEKTIAQGCAKRENITPQEIADNT